jgi:hypothetical protein
VEISGTQDTEGRQNIGQSRDTGNIKDTDVRKTRHNRQSRDTGNIRNTRQRSKTNKAQLTI